MCLTKSTEMCADLKAIQATGKPMIFDSGDGHPPSGVVIGSKVVEPHFSQCFYDLQSSGGDVFSSPEKMNQYECVVGCGL